MTTPRTTLDYLRDIINACEGGLQFVEGFDLAQFLADAKTNHAVRRQIEIIGEASNHVPLEIRLLSPDVPWEQIIGMRNRLIHEYFNVDYETIWETTQSELQPLGIAVRRLLDTISSP